MIQTSTTYAIQLTVVAIILIACLLWMYLSIRKRYRNKRRNQNPDQACAGCALTNLCQAPKSNKSPDHCPNP